MGKATLIANLKEGFQVQNETRSHTWLSDEPIELQGTDKGPTPKELLLSSLASCKLITLRMYADRKQWDLQDACVELEILEEGERTILQKKLTLIGDLSEEQKKRLIQISGKCPVVKMLSKSIEFRLVL